MTRDRMTIQIDKDSILLLEKIFEEEYYFLSNDLPKAEWRLIRNLLNLHFLVEIGPSCELSIKGIFFLAEQGNKDTLKVIEILDQFLTLCNKKIVWRGNDLKEYCQKHDIDKNVFKRSINLGKKTRHISFFLWDIFIHGIEITKQGELYRNDLYSMFSYLLLNERNFKIEFNDESIIRWIIDSVNESENFEVEYKQKIPPQNVLKRIIYGFANSKSGVLVIGIKNDGDVIGIDFPDEEQLKVHSAIGNLNIKLDIKFRILKDKENRNILCVMIPCSEKVLISGNDVIIRDGNRFRKASSQEIVDITLSKEKEVNGHLWFVSLRSYSRKEKN